MMIYRTLMVSAFIFNINIVSLASLKSKRAKQGLNETNPSPEQIKKALESHGLYPFFLPEAPKYAIKVSYGKHVIRFGNWLNSTLVQEEPTSVSWPTTKDKQYILILAGPDGVEIKTKYCVFEHWLVGNIPGDNVAKGDIRTEYVGLTSWIYAEGMYRLMFLVYEQPKPNITWDGDVLSEFDRGTIRQTFNLKDFTEFYKLGAPHAVNFFAALHAGDDDEYWNKQD